MIFRSNRQKVRLYSVVVIFLIAINTSLKSQEKDLLVPEIMKNKLEQKVISHILSKSPKLTSANLIFKFQNPSELNDIPKRAKRYEYDINPKSSLIGQTIVPCVFYDQQGTKISQSLLYVDVDWIGSVVVTTRYLRRGETVGTSDVRLEVKSLLKEPSNHLSTLDQVLGYEIARTIPDGVTMTTWSVRPKPLIRRGEKIFLLTDRSNVQLRVMGVALEDGVLNQTIRVKTLLKNKKIMRGTIKDHETVKIDLLY